MHVSRHSLKLGINMCLCSLQLESLNQGELASRLTLNCQNSYVEPHKIKDVAVTIIDVSVIYYTFDSTLRSLFRAPVIFTGQF